ncbi:MAG: endonuclease/exonuclease/phosphatase family protein [Myxococcota bacterium]
MAKRWILPASLALLLAGWGLSRPAAVAPMATFNIENFPREPTQPRRAARAIGALGVPVVAVQEIRSPERLLAAMHQELGTHWSYVTHRGSSHRVGLLVDSRAYRIVDAKVHDEVRVLPGLRPALEVELQPRTGLASQAVFVVHLKSGPEGEAVRRAQLQALAPIVAARRIPVTVLGDFNPVGHRDRRDLDRFAMAAGLRWNSAQLGCTAYFPDRGRCRGVALDHVMSRVPGSVIALGACATEGCDPGAQCPVGEVSDHCPVVFSPAPRRSLPMGE